MRNFFLTLCFVATNLIMAQDKQVQNFINQAANGNYSSFDSAIAEINNNSNLIQPELIAEFYSLAVGKFTQEDNTNKAIEYFGLLNQIEGKEYFYAKNKTTKNVEYFSTQEQANKATSAGDYAKVKSKLLEPKFTTILSQQMANIPQKLLAEANNQYQAKNYAQAASKYQQVYIVLKALNLDDKMYLNNAAISYQLAQEYEKSTAIYKQLIQDGYTGEKTTYSAILTDTGKKVFFNTEQEMEKTKTLGIYSEYNVEKEESKENAIYNGLLYNMIQLKQYTEALPYVDQALAKFPEDENININAGNIYYKSGNTDKYITKLKQLVEKNPTDAKSWYNLGVMYSQKPNATPEDIQQGLEYFNKSLELNPNDINSYKNITAALLAPEKEYVEKINANLNKKDPKQKKIYDENIAKRKEMYRNLLPYFEKMHQLDPTDYTSANNLKNTYRALGMFDKEDKMIPVVRELKKAQRQAAEAAE